VLPVLRQHVVLRRSAGMDIRLDAELGLFVHGSPSSLAQVLTNVLTNCAKHAPGSPVRIQASRAGDTIRIRVSDFGAGIEQGTEQAVLERGVRGAHSNGHGLGLHICQRLLLADGGRIFIRPRRPNEPGCTVFVELPAAGAQQAHLEPAALSDTS
jgi:two-component system OmpR family sensor kinase